MTDKQKTKPQTALVTGASSGIGLEFCHRLAERKINLLMVSNQERELALRAAEIRNKYDITVYTLYQDLAAENAAVEVVDYADRCKLEIDLLINNAGIFTFTPVCNMQRSTLNLFTDLHMRVVTDLCFILGRRMAQRGYGYILNMSSMSCWMPMPGIAMYSATKAYIRAFSRALHLELHDSGVVVTVACPGGIATDLFGLPQNLKRLALKLHAIVTPKHFTQGAIRALFKGKQQYINGFANRLAIFAIGCTPKSVRMLVKRKLLDRGINKI